MKIALLTEKYPPDAGGLAVSAERLAGALAGAGHAVHVFAPTAGLAPGQTGRGEGAGAIIHRIGAHRRTDDTYADWFGCVTAAHQEVGFDLLHAYFVHSAGFVAVYAGRYLGLPSVASARGNDLDRAAFDPGRGAHARYALEHATLLTANSRDLVRKAQALAPGRDVLLIPNGVDADLFAPAPPDEALARSLGLDGRPCLGFVGEARAKKGLAPLLVAYRRVASRRPAALLIVGGVRAGADRDLLKVFQTQHPDLPVRVVPYLPRESLPAYYNLIDLLLLPSLRDGLPNALLEGMACERAVAAAAVGGIPDAVRDGESGRLVPPGDAAALAAAIHELLDDPDLRRRLGANARRTVRREFTPARELEGCLAAYRRAVADGLSA